MEYPYPIDRIDSLEVAAKKLVEAANLIAKEATDLKKSLSPFPERAPRKGKGITSKTLAKRQAKLIMSKRFDK